MLTQSRLKELLTYDPEAGVFVWLESRGSVSAGARAGNLDHHGYEQIRLDGKLYMSHRLVWLFHTGNWPVDEIDHIDRNRLNNRFPNLREATRSQNAANRSVQKNNKLGVRGIIRRERKQKPFRVQLGANSIGHFATIKEAIQARDIAAKALFGQFA